jgi:hypothetical protein
MFGTKKKQSDANSSKVMQQSSRGNMDEFEALRTIIAENTGLLNRVLEKIRIQRTLSNSSKSDPAKPGLKADASKAPGPEEKKESQKK